MINHDLKLIYIRVTKTASTSFVKTFAANATPLKLVESKDIIPGLKLRNIIHLPSKYISEAVGEEVFRSYLKIAFVRNPWDRILSSYLMGKSYPKSPVFANGEIDTPLPFDGWLKKYDPADPHLYAFGKPKNCLPMAVADFAQGADFIGRFERLEEDFGRVCKLLDLPPLKLPHKNRRVHEHYSKYYNDETRDIVAEKYKQDIDRFGYKFGD